MAQIAALLAEQGLTVDVLVAAAAVRGPARQVVQRLVVAALARHTDVLADERIARVALVIKVHVFDRLPRVVIVAAFAAPKRLGHVAVRRAVAVAAGGLGAELEEGGGSGAALLRVALLALEARMLAGEGKSRDAVI